MDRLARNLAVLLRAHGIVAEIRLRQLLARLGMRLFAGLIATFGLLMLNVAVFFALAPTLGQAYAAVVMAAADFVIALALVGLAARQRASRELELAQDLQTAALDAVLADVRAVEGLVKSPLASTLPGLVAPLAGLLISMLKKRAPPRGEG